MADIFLSYAREDAPKARRVAEALESHGWSVWWDRRIPHGQDFTAQIQQQLDEARCIVVLWSALAIKSSFVRDEAVEGLNSGRLVPLLLEHVKPPLGFRQLQSADLADWTGDGVHDEFDRVVQSIRALIRPAPPPARVEASRSIGEAPAGHSLDSALSFEIDAFISYTHLDNAPLVEHAPGWVTNFRRAFDVRLSQMLGRAAKIWMDPKLAGNDIVADDGLRRLERALFFVAIVSPRYVRAEWTLRELAEFERLAAAQGSMLPGRRSRVLKVMKTPVPLEKMPGILQGTLGYEFFKTDPDSGRIRELDEVFGPEAQQAFWLRVDDLAHDVSAVLLERPSVESSDANTP